jgi:hypothetical protein
VNALEFLEAKLRAANRNISGIQNFPAFRSLRTTRPITRQKHARFGSDRRGIVLVHHEFTEYKSVG